MGLLLLLLLLLLKLKVRSANARVLLLQLELVGVGTLDLRVMAVDEGLDRLKGRIAQLIGHFRVNLLDLLKVIDANVLVSVGLEDVSGYLTAFKA